MVSSDVVAANIKSMDDGELVDRWLRQTFSENAIDIARVEFKRRGIEPPGPEVILAQAAERRRSKYFTLRAIRGVMGFIAAWQAVGLVPVATWLSNMDAVTAEMGAFAQTKVVILFIFGGVFFALRKLINKLHAKRYGFPLPALQSEWRL